MKIKTDREVTPVTSAVQAVEVYKVGNLLNTIIILLVHDATVTFGQSWCEAFYEGSLNENWTRHRIDYYL